MGVLKGLLVAFGLLVILLSGIIIGTMIGFQVAVSDISNCQEVSCGLVGINSSQVQVCEVCPEGGLKIIKSYGRSYGRG